MDPSTPTPPLMEAQRRPRTAGEARMALLRDRGTSLSDIARDLGKDLSALSRVNHGQRRSREIEAAIAQALGLSVADTFPEWYRETT